MLKAYQYRLYPTKAQVSTLNKTFDICRKVYNNTLALRRDAWDYDQKSFSYYDTLKEIVQWKIVRSYSFLSVVRVSNEPRSECCNKYIETGTTVSFGVSYA